MKPQLVVARVHFHSILFCSNVLFFFCTTNVHQALTKCQMLCLELGIQGWTETNITLPLWFSQSGTEHHKSNNHKTRGKRQEERWGTPCCKKANLPKKINLQKTNLPKVNFPNHWFTEFPNRQLWKSICQKPVSRKPVWWEVVCQIIVTPNDQSLNCWRLLRNFMHSSDTFVTAP